MLVLILGLLVFLGVHALRMLAPGFRQRQIAARGLGPWKGLFSLASLAGLALIVWGWVLYRPQAPELYDPPSWAPYVAAVLVWLALVFNFAAYSVSGRIKSTLKHPFVTAIVLWSVAHLIANGDLASVVLFGGFLAFAIWNRVAVALRPDPDPAFVSYRGDVIAIVAGTIAWAIFVLGLHALLFGVAPLT